MSFSGSVVEDVGESVAPALGQRGQAGSLGQVFIRFYAAHGVSLERVLTDRGTSSRSRLFAQTCRQLGLRHLFTRPY